VLRNFQALALGSVLIAVIPGIVSAHHSHAMFDESKEVDVTGTVKRFNFMNPHVYLFLDVTGPDGLVTTWPIEMSYVQNMISRGITASTFKAGDVVTVTINPLRDGHPGGGYTTVIDAAGQRYK
jgi:hypothetical protein